MPTTQGRKINCKKSDETIVAMKHAKTCGAKGRNTNAFLEGKHAIALEVTKKHGNGTPRYKNIVDLDIEKYFYTVNHDKLILILREKVEDAPTLHLIRSFLKAGVLEDGLVSPSVKGLPQE